jgi:hypothetical protein
MECQKRLNDSCATPDTNIELIPSFEIGQHDMFLELTIPSALVCFQFHSVPVVHDSSH